MTRTRGYICILVCIVGSVCLGAGDSGSTGASERIDKYIGELMKIVDGQTGSGSAKPAEKAVEEKSEAGKVKAGGQEKVSAELTDPNRPAEVKAEGADAKVNEVKPADAVVEAAEKDAAESESLIQQVRRENYLPLGDQTGVTVSSGDEMEELLAELRALQFTNAGATAANTSRETAVDIDPAADIEPKEQAVEAETAKMEEPKVPLSELLPDDATKVVDHLALAESLFAAGEKGLAAKYYERALDKFGSNYSKTDSDRAWVLFQIGNCYYNIDPAKAEIVYEQLMREQPGSEWASCANVKRQVLRWMLSEKPLELIESQKK